MRLARPLASLLLVSLLTIAFAPTAAADLRVMAYCDTAPADDCGVSVKNHANACTTYTVVGACSYTTGGTGVGVWVSTGLSPWCSTAPDDCTGVNPVSTCGTYDLVEKPGDNVRGASTPACGVFYTCVAGRCLHKVPVEIRDLGCAVSNPCLTDFLP
ncbi:MAG TPA: hypothetical protein VNZ52_04455 [Candidatus Thermoplasmatota archaeon]|nr:hypothetical protein [Candidatus Thermoplasmatota archaeon]